MVLFQFACPYCSGQFAVENPPAGHAIACPNCGGTVALPADLPPPVAEPATMVAKSPVADDPFDFLDISEPTARPLQIKQRTLPTNVRRLSREEKERRRVRRNLVLMVAGLLVLAIAAAGLSRF